MDRAALELPSNQALESSQLCVGLVVPSKYPIAILALPVSLSRSSLIATAS